MDHETFPWERVPSKIRTITVDQFVEVCRMKNESGVSYEDACRYVGIGYHAFRSHLARVRRHFREQGLQHRIEMQGELDEWRTRTIAEQ